MTWQQQALRWASPAAVALLASLLAVEGGYVNHPSDPGGATKDGVTEAVARADGYQGRMQDFPTLRAARIHYEGYLVKPGFVPLLEAAQPIGEEIFDSAVNIGPAKPSAWIQTALNSLNRRGRDYANITVDGRVGPATLAAYRGLERRRGKAEACELVVKLLDAQQAMHYLRLASNDNAYEDFMPGWTLNRVGNVDFRKCRT